MCNRSDYCLNQLNWNSATAVPSDYFHSEQMTGGGEIYCIEQEGLKSTFGINLLLGKNFKFKNELDDFILRATKGGLILKWLHSVMYRFNRETIPNDPQLKKKQIFPISMVCILISLIAIFVFFAEKIIYRNARRRHANWFWPFAEMLIDPDRHFFLEDRRY